MLLVAVGIRQARLERAELLDSLGDVPLGPLEHDRALFDRLLAVGGSRELLGRREHLMEGVAIEQLPQQAEHLRLAALPPALAPDEHPRHAEDARAVLEPGQHVGDPVDLHVLVRAAPRPRPQPANLLLPETHAVPGKTIVEDRQRLPQPARRDPGAMDELDVLRLLNPFDLPGQLLDLAADVPRRQELVALVNRRLHKEPPLQGNRGQRRAFYHSIGTASDPRVLPGWAGSPSENEPLGLNWLAAQQLRCGRRLAAKQDPTIGYLSPTQFFRLIATPFGGSSQSGGRGSCRTDDDTQLSAAARFGRSLALPKPHVGDGKEACVSRGGLLTWRRLCEKTPRR